MTGNPNQDQEIMNMLEMEEESLEIEDIQKIAESQTPAQIAMRRSHIEKMETLMAQLEKDYDAYKAMEEKINQAAQDLTTLKNWYFSPEWLLDYALDEAGAYDGLDRGVLSEDGLYNLFLDYSQLGTDLARASVKLTEPEDEVVEADD